MKLQNYKIDSILSKSKNKSETKNSATYENISIENPLKLRPSTFLDLMIARIWGTWATRAPTRVEIPKMFPTCASSIMIPKQVIRVLINVIIFNLLK